MPLMCRRCIERNFPSVEVDVERKLAMGALVLCGSDRGELYRLTVPIEWVEVAEDRAVQAAEVAGADGAAVRMGSRAGRGSQGTSARWQSHPVRAAGYG